MSIGQMSDEKSYKNSRMLPLQILLLSLESEMTRIKPEPIHGSGAIGNQPHHGSVVGHTTATVHPPDNKCHRKSD